MKKKVEWDGRISSKPFSKKESKALNEYLEKSKTEKSRKERLENAIWMYSLQIKAYLNGELARQFSVGSILDSLIVESGLSRRKFADFVGLKDSNLSAVLHDKRKIGVELALKLGKTFGMDPSLWVLLQNKMEIEQLSIEKENDLKKLSLDNLLKSAA